MSTTLSGTITVHGDKPARTATVELLNSSGDVVTQSQVDEEGRYIFHITGGDWSLNAWDEHGHRGRSSASLDDGDHRTLDMDLEEPEGGH